MATPVKCFRIPMGPMAIVENVKQALIASGEQIIEGQEPNETDALIACIHMSRSSNTPFTESIPYIRMVRRQQWHLDNGVPEVQP